MNDDQTSQSLENFKRRAFEICLAVYRLTNFFPENETLCRQLREASAQIAASLASGNLSVTISKTEEIKVLLSVARQQNWAGSMNFDLLLTAYCLLADALASQREQAETPAEMEEPEELAIAPPLLEKKKTEVKKEKEAPFELLSESDQRQKKIITFFDKNEKYTVRDLAKSLGGKISERTVRNDLSDMMEKSLIKRVGANKNAFYILN